MAEKDVAEKILLDEEDVFEDQTEPQKCFPLRAIGYDGAAYRGQADGNGFYENKFS